MRWREEGSSQKTLRWRKTDSNCRSPLRRGAFLNRLLPPLQLAKPVETEVFDPRGTGGSNPSSSTSESYTGDQRRATGLEALRCRGSDRRSLGACDGARLKSFLK